MCAIKQQQARKSYFQPICVHVCVPVDRCYSDSSLCVRGKALVTRPLLQQFS